MAELLLMTTLGTLVRKQFRTVHAPVLLGEPLLDVYCGSFSDFLSFHLEQVSSIHPECRFHLEIQEEETKCAELLRAQTEKYKGRWKAWGPTPSRMAVCTAWLTPHSHH